MDTFPDIVVSSVIIPRYRIVLRFGTECIFNGDLILIPSFHPDRLRWKISIEKPRCDLRVVAALYGIQ